MKRAISLVSMLLMVGVASGILAPASTIASPAIYSFNLITPNTAMATSGPFAGDTIRLRGSGSFNTAEARSRPTGHSPTSRRTGPWPLTEPGGPHHS